MNRTIIIPTELNDIPLAKLMQWEQMEGDETQRAYNAIRLFCDLSVSEVNAMPYNVMMEAVETLAQVVNTEPQHQPIFTMNGIEYGFIPNFDLFSSGEYIDIETYLKEPTDIWKVMSVLYRPIIKSGQGGKYDIEPYKGEVNEQFKMMPSGIAIGAKVFFCDLGIDLLNCTLKYLRKVKRRERVMRILLRKSGDGMDSSILLLREILQEWTKLRQCQYTKLYCGQLTKATWQKWKKQNLIEEHDR